MWQLSAVRCRNHVPPATPATHPHPTVADFVYEAPPFGSYLFR